MGQASPPARIPRNTKQTQFRSPTATKRTTSPFGNEPEPGCLAPVLPVSVAASPGPWPGERREPYNVCTMSRLVPASWIAPVILLVSSPGRLSAQAVANATIHGEVTDASGAFVPNAQVKA